MELQTVLDKSFSEIQPGIGAMAVMGEAGDTKHIWDRTKPDEVEAARELFYKLRAKRYLAFSVTKDGSKGEQVTEFNPSEERLIFVPALVGG